MSPADAPAAGGSPRVDVVGTGISGVACAQALVGAGFDVRVLDRGRRPGGRLGLRRVELADGSQHLVDTGAAYFTVSDPDFAALAAGWSTDGLAHPWTDTFSLLGPDGPRGTKAGPQRWSAPGGLRSLVERLAAGLEVTSGHAVRSVGVADGMPALDGRPADAVVLAMPDPQAGRLLDVEASPGLASARRVLSRPWDAVITVYAAWDEAWWPALDAGFVADDDLVSLLADDGSRRGDGAPVLVAHTTADAARGALGDPDSLVRPVLERLPHLLGAAPGDVPEPRAAAAHRWSFASPSQVHDAPHLLTAVAGGLLGVCGDAWAATSSGRPRVEQAWRSGRDLGRELAERLA
ncbi:NAD/FAD-dependent oxidoreductase [Streptomyces sp. NP160]|uniref:NAD(P)/FAD-dependent oxidoreductase n=1 Tax=Streptomyces sp. NP160 TaxID=2586637 RepID=UPI001118B4FB|nr:FAD-dependent oxidoreductase [Streptomyces sp. NP160]TNM69127.1 NAD/FAD-dependent oxidoreductase [Streptomyces sp. NP160]